ncbi:rhomboid family intramembrane serine protease [Metabacillus elymi]|uniref:Rhomboid family intramembrane serine protease n=1 Tax=Metabacillus elymi TaxID=2745198 RepID=A0ABX6S1H3_9BACI|nr:rhomboid family intramembrane serine protease [Metabacillus sp. KUDC1714]QNF27894.1 rhomboid family intramembrane serine protease [Metabacillus sp. KUDC1714]
MFTRTESFRTFLQLYPVVSILVGIHILFWLLFQLPIPSVQIILRLLDGYNAGIANGEYWRLVTPIFLHISFGHLFFNTVSLILFAPTLEKMLKKRNFIFIYLGSGLIADIATYLLEPQQYSHLGASGAIFGLFGVYLFMVYFRKGIIDQANSQVIISILVIGLVMTFFNSNINIVAHIFGFLGGFALAPFFIKKRGQFVHQTYYTSSPSTSRFSIKQVKGKHVIWIIFGLLILIGIFFRFS